MNRSTVRITPLPVDFPFGHLRMTAVPFQKNRENIIDNLIFSSDNLYCCDVVQC